MADIDDEMDRSSDLGSAEKEKLDASNVLEVEALASKKIMKINDEVNKISPVRQFLFATTIHICDSVNM